MGKPCERCKQLAEYNYWDVMEDQGKCFFKIMMGNFKHEMIVPNKFVEHFKGSLSSTIKLETRNGSICNIGVKRCADKLILKYGWDEFVNKHDIMKGDFLVFRYNGNSEFKVGVFDPSGCEKASSCVNLNYTVSTANFKSYDEWYSMKSSSSTPSEPGYASSSEDYLEVNSYIVGSSTQLTPAQKKIVKQKVQIINSDIPILVTIMSKSSVHRKKCSLEFKKSYAEEYLPREKQTVILLRHGKSWKTLLGIRSDGRKSLRRGWRQFARENDLKIGDICLFDLLKDQKRCTMNVHIIHATKCGGPAVGQ